MSLETLMTGPHLSWSKTGSTTCALDIMTAAVKAGIPFGPELGNVLRSGFWGQLPPMLPEGTAERQILGERIQTHMSWLCKHATSGLPCADWHDDAEQFLRDKVKTHEETTGVPITAIASGTLLTRTGHVDELLAVSRLTLPNLMEYAATFQGSHIHELTRWSLHEPRANGALLRFELEYSDTDGDTSHAYVSLYPLTSEQELIFHQWNEHNDVTPDEIRMLSTTKPADYPLLRALPGRVKRHPHSQTWERHSAERSLFRETFEEVRPHLTGLTSAEQEAFLTLLPNWEDPLEELAKHSKAITSDAVHAPAESK